MSVIIIFYRRIDMKIMMLLNLILIFCLFQCSSEDTLIDERKFEVVIDFIRSKVE